MTDVQGLITAAGWFVTWAFLGFTWIEVRRGRRRMRDLMREHDAIIEVWKQEGEGPDPGREAHDRLARALEYRMVVTAPDLSIEPHERRVAAQAFASGLIEDIHRAGLQLVVRDGPE